MQDTRIETLSTRHRVSAPRRLARGLPAVALAALALAFGCSGDGASDAGGVPGYLGPLPTAPGDSNPVNTPPAVTDPEPGSPGDGIDPEDDVDRIDEGNPDGPVDLEGGGQQPPVSGEANGGDGQTPADDPAQPAEPTPNDPEPDQPEPDQPEPGQPEPEQPPPDEQTPPADVFVEDSGADCQVPQLPAAGNLPQQATLPDPFLGLNGQRITTRDQWRCRREEIRRVAERFIYGQKPGRPEGVSGNVSTTSITVNVQNAGRNASFNATVTMPQGAAGPVPAIIGYGGSNFQNTITAEGVAFINYNLNAVGDETTNPKQGAFYTVNPERADSGMLVAWAWGVSRLIDVIEASGAQIINPRAIGVHGCSRNGKGAFIAGAFDERVALTLPFESGMAGVPAWRLVVPEGGETPRNAIEYRPWAGDAYRQFLSANNAQLAQLQNQLPIDTHEIIGMVAPRGLFVMGNPHIVNLAPRSEHVTVLAGAEIYQALGVEQNITYLSNIQDGTHCAFRQEFVQPLQQNIRKFLKNDANASTGAITPHANATGQLGPNINWQTPALQ